jgi:hypothetical protein
MCGWSKYAPNPYHERVPWHGCAASLIAASLLLLASLMVATPASAGVEDCIPSGTRSDPWLQCAGDVDGSNQCTALALTCAKVSVWGGAFASCPLPGGGYGPCVQGGADGEATTLFGFTTGHLEGLAGNVPLYDVCQGAGYCDLHDEVRGLPGSSVVVTAEVCAEGVGAPICASETKTFH